MLVGVGVIENEHGEGEMGVDGEVEAGWQGSWEERGAIGREEKRFDIPS